MKKGFTLIELLTVISLIAIISVLVLTNVSSNINRQKDNISDVTKTLIIDAAEDYVNESEKLSNSNESFCIKIKDLISNNYLSSNMLKENGGEVDNKLKIFVDKNTGFEYTIDTDNICSLYLPPNEDLIDSLKKGENSGLVADAYEPGRYYFRGANPKNKLILQEKISGTITDVDYRIISFEADGTIKVVREGQIILNGCYAWDATNNRPTADHSYCNDSLYGCNAWANQSNTYRNGALMNNYFSLQYYANNTATSMTIDGTETGDTPTTVTKDSSLNESLNTTFLTTNLEPIKDYIDEHMWDVGGVKYLEGKSFKKDIDETKVNQWKGYIALPSIIDYKNASDNTTQCINVCSGYTLISETSYYPCTKNSDGTVNNYLYKSSYHQWTLSAYVNDRYLVWYVNSSGNFNKSRAYYGIAARPAFYLKSTIQLTGEGIEGNEFKIAES